MPEQRMVKNIYLETDVNTTIRKTKEQMGRCIINDIKKLKIKNWTSCIQDRNKCKLYVQKAKPFKE
jgi:predicted enzyme related to lactoylglutathione lyase